MYASFFKSIKKILKNEDGPRDQVSDVINQAEEVRSTPAPKSWIGITSTQVRGDLNLDSVFDGSLSKGFETDDLKPSILFDRQCEVFTSKEEAFRVMGHKIRSSKSTYVLETPYEKNLLITLISEGRFHECFTKATNVSDYGRFTHNLLPKDQIEERENLRFNRLLADDLAGDALVLGNAR
jgi:hypothetical protein